MYHKFGLAYSTPTIWTYIFPEEYIRFLENLRWYLKQSLKFKKETKHPMAQRFCKVMNRNYPIGVLGGDVEVHFMHYRSEEEAFAKWNRRTKRVNLKNLFVVFSDGVEFKEELLERYEKLPFKHKIFFSSKPFSNYKSTVFVKDYANAAHVYDSTHNRKYEKYLDLVKWLNGEENFLKTKKKLTSNGYSKHQIKEKFRGNCSYSHIQKSRYTSASAVCVKTPNIPEL
jgi:uncharacterized protein (DUF1919 family)